MEAIEFVCVAVASMVVTARITLLIARAARDKAETLV
jgi:hypothetical protein